MVSLPTRFKNEAPATTPESLSGDEKDWELVGDGSPEEQKKIDPTSVGLDIHRSQDSDGVIVSVRSPKGAPASLGERQRLPVDIVLVIDVSWSMEDFVDCPVEVGAQSASGDQSGNEPSYRHSVLDLVKNAALAVIENLDEQDRIGIVTFGYDAEIAQELTYVTSESRESIITKVQSLEGNGATNLWAGLRKGYQMMSSAGLRSAEKSSNQALSAIYLLTDGLPNVMPPVEGYVPALRKLIARETGKEGGSVVPSLHTFGFGYNLRSGLLQSMAEVGGGYYGFIPNGFLIATIFTHAVANLFATFTTSATLRVTVSGCSEMPKPLEGATLYRQKENALEISLYNLQYGQTRDVLLVWPKELEKSNSASITISAALEYTGPGLGSQPAKITTEASSIPKNPNPAFAKYHLHRSMVCEFLNSLSKLDGDEEYITMPINDLDKALTRLDELIRKIKSSDCAGSGSQDFLYDLGSSLDEARANSSADPAGQVMQALFRPMYFDRWGKHYLPSLLHAYRHQLCLNEKDHGPKAFVATNPLFHHFKEAQSTSWDKAQDRLMEIVKKQARADAEAAARGEQQRSPPAYSYSSSRGLAAQPSSRVISMAAYNNPHNPCFAGSSHILLASGRRIPVRLLRRGAAVLTPAGPRRVAAVVETALRSVALCELGELLVTPWHPVFDAQSAAWVFPATVAEARVRRGVKVYSVMLEEGRGPEAHAVDVGGYWCVTLGHGVVEKVEGDARGHEFFGDYARVRGELRRLPQKGKGGVLRCGGMRRDEVTGLACGFERPGRGRNGKVRRRYGGCQQKISAILP